LSNYYAREYELVAVEDLAKVEEEEVMENIEDKEAYRAYIEETPRFI
jgi:hypothetical protein